jgi:two-component system aerobic respiration control sensor histidine kinase ArcB
MLEQKKLLDALLNKYHDVVGVQNHVNIPSEKIIDHIIGYYEDIINCMPGNVYWFDKNGVSVGCNQNVLSMFGTDSLSKFKGLTFEQMGVLGNWSHEATMSFKKDTLDVINSGKPKLNIEEPPIPHSNGKMIYFLTSRVPLFDQLNRVIGMVGISVDISELKETQAALEVAKEKAELASQAKSEFMANMSHDIKTPLAGIIGISELLTHRLSDENKKLAETLMSSGKQLLNFLDNCLEIAKTDNNSNPIFATHDFSLKFLVKEISELFRPAIQAKDLAFNVSMNDSMPSFITGCRESIYRVLLNLIGNAIKFTTEGSVSLNINVTTKNEPLANKNAELQISIKDTGIGIAKKDQAIIFERFTRLTSSYKGIYEGSGIGLYIVQSFVDKMGGSIHLDSSLGEGCEFTITIPVGIPVQHDNIVTSNKNEPSLKLRNPKIDKNKSHRTQAKVLLVEDNLIAQQMGNYLLSSLNCQVDIAESGERALEMFEPGKFDFIIMDIGLPAMQGDAAARMIREKESNTNYHVPIFALTAHLSSETKDRYLASGINEVFSKPLLFDQAKELVNASQHD